MVVIPMEVFNRHFPVDYPITPANENKLQFQGVNDYIMCSAMIEALFGTIKEMKFDDRCRLLEMIQQKIGVLIYPPKIYEDYTPDLSIWFEERPQL